MMRATSAGLSVILSAGVAFSPLGPRLSVSRASRFNAVSALRTSAGLLCAVGAVDSLSPPQPATTAAAAIRAAAPLAPAPLTPPVRRVTTFASPMQKFADSGSDDARRPGVFRALASVVRPRDAAGHPGKAAISAA